MVSTTDSAHGMMSAGSHLCASIITLIFVPGFSMPSVAARRSFSSQNRHGPNSSGSNIALELRYPSST